MYGLANSVTITRRTVKEYLQQYWVAYERKRFLERRCQVLQAELSNPSLPSSFKSAPAVSGGQSGDGAVGVVFRLAEVETRLADELLQVQQTLLTVMDLVALLPENSLQRTIVELRHIDRRSWENISRAVHFSRSRVNVYYNAALDYLLDNPRAHSLLENFLHSQQRQDTTGHRPVV